MGLFKFNPEVDARGKVFVTGFQGIGSTGYWCVRYLIENLKAERISVVEGDVTPPITNVSSSRIVTPFELYGKGELLFFRAESMPYGGKDVEFYRRIAEWVVNSGIREASLVGGLNVNLRSDDSEGRIAYTSAFRPRGELKNFKFLEDDHLIVGPVATMLNYFEACGFPAYAILAYAYPDRIDPKAAAVSAKMLSRQYEFEVDVEPLIKGAEVIEEELRKREEKERRDSEESFYT